MKIFIRKGQHDFKAKRLERDLIEFFEKNPDKAVGFVPATTMEELQGYHSKYCIEDTEILSETTNPKKEETTHESFRDSMNPDKSSEDLFTAKEDPMNRDEPKIRDYVLNDGFAEDTKKEEAPSNFSEPTNFRDSFGLPPDANQPDSKDNKGSSKQNIFNSPPPPKKESGPVDPNAKIIKKSRKKFTKHAVNAVLTLAGKGFIWYATKDISDAKLAKALAEGEIDEKSLKMICWLDNGLRGTVMEFFQNQKASAEELAKFSQEDKDDLAEALDDWMEFKQIKIDPFIELLTVGLGIFAEKAITAMVINSRSGNLFQQIKDSHRNTEQAYDPASEPVNEDPASKETAPETQE